MVRGRLGVLISQMGKKGIEGKVIFLVTVRYAHHWFPDIFQPLPSIFFHFCWLHPPFHSISPSLSLTLSLALPPSVPVGLKWLKVTLIWLDFSTEQGGENKTTRVQQCTVNTFTPIKLVKTSKNAIWKCCGPDWCPRCALAEACPKTFLTASICYALEHLADTTHAPATAKQSVLPTRDSLNERTA